MGYPLKLNVIRTEKLKFPDKGGKYGKNARGSRAHNGWDLKAPLGTPVHAVAAGKISLVLEKVGGYGTIIQLEFVRGPMTYWALYAHLGKAHVKTGDLVTEGMIIGRTGDSGNAKGQPPHLHFEVATSKDLRKGRDNRIDPAEILGDFLKDQKAGAAGVIESSYHSDFVELPEMDIPLH